jgi:hypothetical protein
MILFIFLISLMKGAKMKNYFYCKCVVVLLFFFNNLLASTSNWLSQDDTVKVPDIAVVPTINGIGDDECWQNISWQSIDQIWVPDTAVVSSADYSGHYKIAWSDANNLLYFLIEVNDNVFIDGYIRGATADIYNFDITEVFIDEDASGGLHMNDGGQQNAENAFAYHIYADYPGEDSITTDPYVGDMATTPPNYDFHFPEFALRKTGNTATWEFSLIVYNDTYSPTNIDNARVQLQEGKVIGLSVAYCDNDNPDGMRDNMFGSVWEPAPKNRHWQNADYFGKVQLISGVTSIDKEEQTVPASGIKIYPNPASSSSHLQFESPNQGEVSIRLFNILGEEVFRTSAHKTNQLFTNTLVLNHLTSGLYFIQVQLGHSIFSEKLIITNR